MIALRKIGIAFAGVCASVAAAAAADLPRRSDPYVPPAFQPAPRWTGAYVGAHIGGGFGKGGSVSTDGLLGGVHGGYNVQMDRFVLGGEGDISASGVGNKSFTEKVRNSWLASGRARAGYLVDPSLLVYGTGGIAVGSTTNQSPYGKYSDTKSGWVLGAGGEYLLSPNVALRGEYLYYSLGKSNFPTANGPVAIDNHVNVLRAGASYKF
jgi:outer membrane immunogenic protein